MSPDPKPIALHPGPARKQVLEQERWERTDAVASEAKGFWAHMMRIQVTRGHSPEGDRRRCQSCTSRKSSQHNFITITLHADTACDGKSAKSKLYNEQIAGASSVSMTVGIMRKCWTSSTGWTHLSFYSQPDSSNPRKHSRFRVYKVL